MTVSILEFPTQPCRACNGMDWYITGGAWVCGRCHPPTDKEVALRFRIIKANIVLNQAFRDIIPLEGEERAEVVEQFNAAVSRLQTIVQQLKEFTTDCIYIEDGKKIKQCLENVYNQCWGCPNEYWPDKELMELDRAKSPKKES